MPKKIFSYLILIFGLTPIQGSATVYEWVSIPCQISGTLQDSTSDISNLAKIEFTLNASYMEDSDGSRKLLKKGVRMERNPDIPKDLWDAVYSKFIPYIANWKVENTDGYDPEFLLQANVEYETIYRLLMAMNGNRLKMSHNLEIPDMAPYENGLYHFLFWLDEEHDSVQMHLPLSEENGLSHHLRWGCGRANYQTKPIDLGDTSEHPIEPPVPFSPVIENSTATFDERGFNVTLKDAPQRAVHQRFRYEKEEWSDWLEISNVISYLPSDINKFLGKRLLEVQYVDASEIKSAPIRTFIKVDPPEYITAPLKADFKRINCFSSGGNWLVQYHADIKPEFVQYRWPEQSTEWTEILKRGVSIYLKADRSSCSTLESEWYILEVKDKFGFIKTEKIYFE